MTTIDTAREHHPTLVSFRNVQKSYDGETLVVRDLNLDIRSGEFLSLLGPSGSGKTTCLMMLAGFEFPTAGDIIFDGRNLNNVPPHKRDIGMVFQNYALFPHLTVERNVEYPLKVRRMDAAERRNRVAAALEMVQMGAFGKRYPRQLSGGQQQRIALARALVFDPKLVLMDEPLGALDKQLREHMQLELKALHRSLGITFVYVTHDQSEALTMSDRVAVFDQGVIQQISTVDALYESPCNRFVAGFVGDCNQLHGHVVDTADAYCAVRLRCGAVVNALNVQHLGTGAQCVIAVRPERLSVEPQGAENSVTARVTDTVYFGDHIRLRCSTADDQPPISVKLALGDNARLNGLAPGMPVTLKAAPEHIRAFAL